MANSSVLGSTIYPIDEVMSVETGFAGCGLREEDGESVIYGLFVRLTDPLPFLDISHCRPILVCMDSQAGIASHPHLSRLNSSHNSRPTVTPPRLLT